MDWILLINQCVREMRWGVIYFCCTGCKVVGSGWYLVKKYPTLPLAFSFPASLSLPGQFDFGPQNPSTGHEAKLNLIINLAKILGSIKKMIPAFVPVPVPVEKYMVGEFLIQEGNILHPSTNPEKRRKRN